MKSPHVKQDSTVSSLTQAETKQFSSSGLKELEALIIMMQNQSLEMKKAKALMPTGVFSSQQETTSLDTKPETTIRILNRDTTPQEK